MKMLGSLRLGLRRGEVDPEWAMRGMPLVHHRNDVAEYESRGLQVGTASSASDLCIVKSCALGSGAALSGLDQTLMECVRSLWGPRHRPPKVARCAGLKRRRRWVFAILNSDSRSTSLDATNTSHHGPPDATPTDGRALRGEKDGLVIAAARNVVLSGDRLPTFSRQLEICPQRCVFDIVQQFFARPRVQW
ncbi:hypothetical protein P3T18_000955 [Paraburkholderia sp. GAS199]